MLHNGAKKFMKLHLYFSLLTQRFYRMIKFLRDKATEGFVNDVAAIDQQAGFHQTTVEAQYKE